MLSPAEDGSLWAEYGMQRSLDDDSSRPICSRDAEIPAVDQQ
jgi:hypothetical protein